MHAAVLDGEDYFLWKKLTHNGMRNTATDLPCPRCGAALSEVDQAVLAGLLAKIRQLRESYLGPPARTPENDLDLLAQQVADRRSAPVT